MNAFTPPVPPVPAEHRTTPTSIHDVFSTGGNAVASHYTPRSIDQGKPLPPIVGTPVKTSSPRTRDGEDLDERSIVFVDKMSAALPPLPPSTSSTPLPSPRMDKRRSMSYTEVDFSVVPPPRTARPPETPDHRGKNKLASSLPAPITTTSNTKASTSSSAPVLEHKWDDTTLNGLLDVFKGELSSLDRGDASLDLRDPSSPGRQLLYRKKTNGLVLSMDSQDDRAKDTASPQTVTSPVSPSSPTSPLSSTIEGDSSAIVPPRSSSLNSPARYSVGSPPTFRINNGGPPARARTGPYNQTSPRPGDPNNRLRVLHRSTASSSEPSLIPPADELRLGERSSASSAGVMRKASLNSSLHAYRSAVAGSSGVSSRTSQQDLKSPDSATFGSATTPSIQGEENGDIETRGKELATRCWNEDDDFLPKEKIAEWLGGMLA